jgi:hypothetical protein
MRTTHWPPITVIVLDMLWVCSCIFFIVGWLFAIVAPWMGWSGAPIFIVLWTLIVFLPLFTVTLLYQRKQRSLTTLRCLDTAIICWATLTSISLLFLCFADRATIPPLPMYILLGVDFIALAFAICLSVYMIRVLTREVRGGLGI